MTTMRGDGDGTRGRGARRLRTLLAASLVFAAMNVGAARANPFTTPEDPPEARAEERVRPGREEALEPGAANPSANAIIRSLAPFADGNPGAPPARPLAVTPADGGPPVRVDTARAVDLVVYFPYDSDRLTAAARSQLEPLGRALRSGELARHAFLIAGHTDGAGDYHYNLRLSLARARAVKAYLVEAHGIEPERLRVHGWGPARLKNPDRPLAPVNRRVEVSLIAPRGAWLPQAPDVEIACAHPGLADPRRRVRLDLDDFDAAPTVPGCGP